MPKINDGSSYPTKPNLVGSDRFIGSDSQDNEKTKNFSLEGVLGYVGDNLNLGGDQNNKIREIEINLSTFDDITDQYILDIINTSPPFTVEGDELIVFKVSNNLPE